VTIGPPACLRFWFLNINIARTKANRRDMKQTRNDCDLQSCFLCRNCLPEWIPAIGTHRKNLSFKKGETIFKEGDPVNGIYFVYTGNIKVHKKWGSEKELIIRIAKKGDIFGHRGLGHDHHYPISATALEPVKACYIDLEFFRSTVTINQHFIYELMLFFADELQESEQKMRNLAHMQVKGRVAQTLLALKEKFGVTGDGAIDIVLSRQDLASFAGTTYETVFRIINELVRDGIIQLKGKEILIEDQQQLKTYTLEEN
jgi:CRP/FNR family transcriptional regulator